MKTLTYLKQLFFLLCFAALTVSCSSSDSPAPTPVDTKPTISSFSPQSASLGSTLTIIGTNFSTTAANNVVTINGVTATVTAATATQLTVTVPACSGTGVIKVSIGGNAASSSSLFTFISTVFAGGNSQGQYASGVLWKDGKQNAIFKNDPSGIVINGITYIDTDQYACGNFGNTACYWKNGNQINLSVPANYTSGATSIFVSGTDVYISGFVKGPYSPKNPAYWKNGVLTIITSTYANSEANSIFVVGNDVYAAGYITSVTTGGAIAYYWKNQEVPVALTTNRGTTSSEAKSIFVSNGIVYVAGWEGEFINNSPVTTSVAKLWKNGTPQSLSNGNFDANANFVTVDGSDIYVGGDDNNVATVWKNGTPTKLSNIVSSINVLYLKGTDIYSGGYESRGSTVVGTIWKNGVNYQTLEGESGNSSVVNSIYVK